MITNARMGEEVTYMPELTIKEVIQILKHNYEDEMRYHEPNKRYAEAMRIGYTELEKQIPTKVIYEADSFTDKFLCPKCRHDMDGYEFPYCPACGQKIDWR